MFVVFLLLLLCNPNSSSVFIGRPSTKCESNSKNGIVRADRRNRKKELNECEKRISGITVTKWLMRTADRLNDREYEIQRHAVVAGHRQRSEIGEMRSSARW